MKLTLEQQYILTVLQSQYHFCWCFGNFRSQGISRHDIDPQSRNILSPASEELIKKIANINANTIEWDIDSTLSEWKKEF